MFTRFARWAARAMGTPLVFFVALLVCALWLFAGPLFDHDLTGRGLFTSNLPTLFTLLMVFLVQHTQNHHNDSIQAKLDELIRAVEGANNAMVHLEELSPEELVRVRARYQALADRLRASPDSAPSTDTPAIDPLPPRG
jgi:low affinity Fe/Cu permease